MSGTLVIENCAVATVDGRGSEYAVGYVVVSDGRIVQVGPGAAPVLQHDGARVVDGSGCLATPGLVNSHHHLYQWIFRGLARDATLFDWLTELYPKWARIDEPAVHAAARAGLGWLALSGCTTSSDHHYLFPRGSGDLLGATIRAAREVGVRLDATRGSMDLGRSAGGLPPDSVVENLDEILDASREAVERYHDPSPGALTRIALAPCSPFSVTDKLMKQSAVLARELGVRLHTHLAETVEEDAYCREQFGVTPAQYVESLGWMGEDVWFAHGVHLDDAAIARMADTGTGLAHCPSSNGRLGAGLAPIKALLNAGAPVGLGVDGAASQESGMLVEELRQAVYVSRYRALTGAADRSLDARTALHLATAGGARVLGRQDEIGSLEPGYCADIALWKLDGLGHADITDPVAALVFGPPAPLKLLTVRGEVVVEDGELRNVDAATLARDARAAHLRMMEAS